MRLFLVLTYALYSFSLCLTFNERGKPGIDRWKSPKEVKWY